ncbi:MAG TPA: hypothetical protein VFR37_12525 [Longimicrobium sp.]|nr:hypothetical protein [Longimicrobium sp.]
MRSSSRTVVLAFALAAAPAAAQDTVPAPPPASTPPRMDPDIQRIFETARQAREGGNLLTELQALRGLAPAYAASGQAARTALAREAMRLEAEAGNYTEALRQADLAGVDDPWEPDPAAGAQLQGLRPEPALEALSRAAAGERVVMVNEAHHVPQHRAFALQLLARLWEQGYRYLAAESLWESEAELAARGYPAAGSGGYLSEPLYGDLVRTALALGYTVVPYESARPGAGGDREQGQAANLVQRILARDPGARILVHAGYNHVNESGLLAGVAPMAVRFREMTGIDPLTVDQTVMTERGAPEREHPLYRHAAGAGLLEEPTVLRSPSGALWTLEPGKRDVTVFHPRSVYRDGRPTWLRLGGARAPHPLPADVCAGAERCLVSARAAAEGGDAVPVDQVEVVRGGPPPALLLPPGSYRVRVEDAAGTLLRQLTLSLPR